MGSAAAAAGDALGGSVVATGLLCEAHAAPSGAQHDHEETTRGFPHPNPLLTTGDENEADAV